GGAAGASRALQVKDGHAERPCLWAAVVGHTGTAKTPALGLVCDPVHDEEDRRRQEYRRGFTAHDEDPDGHARPVLVSVCTGDVTRERLARKLMEGPRGLVLIHDELTAWVRSMDQYRQGRGADRQFFLSAWSGSPISVEREKDRRDPLFVRHL